MDKALKQKWIAALRSGKYAQARECLKQESKDGSAGFCCLGVLLDISELGNWDINCYLIPDEEGGTTMLDGDLASYRSSLGITSTQHGTLIEMNDDRGNTFSEIADFIEEHL